MDKCVTRQTKVFLKLILITLLPLISQGVVAQFIVTYRHLKSEEDKRSNYETQLLRLALDKTTEDFGEYRMIQAPSMSVARGLISLTNNIYTNLILAYPYEYKYSENNDLSYIKFPIELGILGMRTCFVNSQNAKKLSKVTNIIQLQEFSHGLGKDWGDVNILKHNEFNVIEVGDYDNIIPMLALGRFDLFCRGTNEVLGEVERFKEVENVKYDTHIAFHYTFPRFFYFNTKNDLLNKRITQGILKAYEDGSLIELWRKEHQASIDFVNIPQRKVFNLYNPNSATIDFDFKKYFFNWQN